MSIIRTQNRPKSPKNAPKKHQHGQKRTIFWGSNFWCVLGCVEMAPKTSWVDPRQIRDRLDTLRTWKPMFGIWQESERIWTNLSGSAVILGISRSWQLPLALRLPNPLTTRKLVDCQSEVVPTRSTAGGSADISNSLFVRYPTQTHNRRAGGWTGGVRGGDGPPAK